MDIENNTEQEPELQVWALEHFNQMAPKAVWRPDGTGLRYRKIDDLTLMLEHRVDHPQAEAHHAQLKSLYESVNITVVDDNVMITDAALSAEEAFRREVEERQAIAGMWKCECGVLLKDMELSKGVPVFMGERETLFDDGETRTIEDWGIKVQCSDCPKPIMMNPDDYNLLAGDDLFMRYKSVNDEENDVWLSAMTRQQMYDTAVAGELGILVGAECPVSGGKVPPWMWGTYCSVSDVIDEEE
tara:strand:- start:1551 stop:2279 length:729 start_codon:yes stop_codon:yes gene_type:complete